MLMNDLSIGITQESAAKITIIILLSVCLCLFSPALPAEEHKIPLKTSRRSWSAALPELVKPTQIAIKGNELYVIEDAYVYVYSLYKNQVRLLRKMGKKGEGPGEFDTNTYFRLRLKFKNNNLLLYTNYKMGLFNPQGKLQEEKTFPFFIYRLDAFGDGYVLTKSTLDEKNNQISIIISDSRMNPISVPFQRPYLDLMRTGKFSLIPDFVYSEVYQNELYIFDNQGDFIVYIFSQEGKLKETISLEVPRIRVNAERKKQIQAWINHDWRFSQMGETWRGRMIIPEYLPVLRSFSIDGGVIYTHTFNRERNHDEFIMIQLQGKKASRVFLPHDSESLLETLPYQFYNNCFYLLSENMEDEQWELSVYEIR